MINKKIILSLILGIFLIGILPIISPVGEISFCCEKTVYGAWCMNEPADQCDDSINPTTKERFRSAPTSCEATSFCKLGCCYDSQDGNCMENTPEAVCNEDDGVYSRESPSCDIPQCELGCCLIGQQAAFVTQTRCKRLSALYGLETNFRTDISNEVQCIASATSDVMGACVFEREYEKTCRLITQKECKELEGTSENTNIEFYQGYLCSAEELATNCGPSRKTTCVEERDEVYFLDTCGNLANIYDSTKEKSKLYWTKIFSRDKICNSATAAGSATCGNCDYYQGSTCKTYDKKKDRVKPVFGNNICRDLKCEYEGEEYQHGETWCATNSKTIDIPGSEYFRLVCYNGEVTIEPCASFRAERCVQDEISGFKTAACRVNIWQDCVAQDDEDDCLNTDKRDCNWIKSGNQNWEGKDIYVCAPKYAPGFNFWEEEETEDICSLANTECVAKFEKGLLEDSWKCVENCHCCVDHTDKDGDKYEDCKGGEAWERNKDNLCEALGDCGRKKNYIEQKGYDYEDSFVTCNGGYCGWE